MGTIHDKHLIDMPTVSMLEAARISGLGRDKFRRRFLDCLHREIRNVQTHQGRRLLLVDVIRCAFPEMSEDAVHHAAIKYCLDRGAERKRAALRSKRGDWTIH